MLKPILAALLIAVASARAEEVIKVAVCCPLSGAQAGLGEFIKLGAQIAVEEGATRLAALGYKLELSPQDDQATPDVGVAVAKRLVNDPALLGVVGHFNSGVAIPASEVYKDYDLAMVSPANTNPKVTERRYGNVNRVCGRDDVQGPVAAEFAVNELKAKRVFVVQDKTAYGQGVAEAFRDKVKALGGNVVSYVGTEEKSNFAAIVLQMQVMSPDLVYLGGIYDQGGVLVKQMREKGIKATFLGPDAFDSSEFVKIAQQAAIGTYYTTVAGPVDQYPAARSFADKFQAKFQKPPESFALYAYDAANVLIAAIESAVKLNSHKFPSRESVCLEIRKVNLDGITGHIEFDDKGDRKTSDYYIVKLEEAKYPGKAVKVISASPPK